MNLYQPTISGSLVVSGSVSVIGPFTMSGGSISGTSSFAVNAGLLQGLDSTSFVGTGSFNTMSSSVSTRVTTIESKYATTGSNIFTGAQTVCANITSTGTIIAQTLNVQQVTSSVVYSSGSNIFGCSLVNTQQFTGSVTMTGSLAVFTAGTTPEFQVAVGGNTLGNALTDVHQVTGSLRITGSLTNTGVTTLNNQLQLSYANPDVAAIQITATTGTCASAMVFNNTGGNFYIGKDNSTGGRLTLSAVPYANAVWAENCCAISFGVGNVERFRISCNDIINIGNTTTANNKTIQFQVDTSLSYSGRIQMSNDTSILYLNGGGNIGYNFGAGIELVGKDRYACCHGGQLTLRAGNSVNNASFGYIAFETCNAERMRVTIAGNVGIGTCTPGAKLEIAGATILNPPVSAGTSTYLQFNNSGSVAGYVGSAAAINSGAASSIALGVASGAGLTIASTGAATFACSITGNQITSNYVSGSLPAMFRLCDGNGGTDAKWWMIETRSTSGNDKWYAVTSLNDAQNAISYGMRIHATNNTVDQVLFPNGNVGIGTSTPNFALEVCKTDGSVRFGTNTRHTLFCTQTGTGNISYTGFRYDDNGLIEVIKLLNNYSGTGYGNAIGFYGNGDKQMGYIKMSQTDASNTQAKMVVGVRCNDGAYDAFTVFPGAITCFASTVCAPNFITAGANASVRGGDPAFFRGSTVTQSGNSITFDAFRFLNPTGGVGGAASSISGRLYMSFHDTSTGGNQVSYQYLIITTGNGVSPGPYCFVQLYCGPVRGTNPISAISLVNDGAGGAVKVQATTAASGVAGAVAYITYVGTAV